MNGKASPLLAVSFHAFRAGLNTRRARALDRPLRPAAAWLRGSVRSRRWRPSEHKLLAAKLAQKMSSGSELQAPSRRVASSPKIPARDSGGPWENVAGGHPTIGVSERG